MAIYFAPTLYVLERSNETNFHSSFPIYNLLTQLLFIFSQQDQIICIE